MSDTQSIYKSVLGLTETGGTLFLVPCVQYRREALAYSYNQQVRPDDYLCSPFKVATPVMSNSSNPSIRCEDRRSCTVLILFDFSSYQLLRMGINLAFPNNPRILQSSVIATHHTPHSNPEYSLIKIFTFLGKGSY